MSPIRLGLAGGIIFGICTLIVTWLSIGFDYGTLYINVLSSIYPGYVISPIGSVIGMIWAFADAFVFFGLLGWIHNLLGTCCKK